MTLDELIQLMEKKRLAKKYSKVFLSDQTGISQQQIADFLNQTGKSLSFPNAVLLMNTLGITSKTSDEIIELMEKKRLDKKYSKVYLAKQTDIAKQQVSHFFNKKENISLVKVLKLMEILRVKF